MKNLKRGIIYYLPDGHQWDAVDYPRTFAAALPLTSQGTIILLEQHRFPAERRMLVLAGGAPEGDENLENTARRELLEESGYQAGKLELLVEGFRLHAAANTAKTNIYAAWDCRRVSEPLPDEVERIAGLRSLELTYDQVRDLLARGDTAIDSTLFAALCVLMARGKI